MASRVNTRFVILLIVGVIALLGAVIAAYSVAFKTAADHAREGDRLLAEGNVKLAEFSYSKAVNKDTTNVEYLDKWIESLEMLVPETETEYRDLYNGDYKGAISKKATVLRDDIEAHDRQLNIAYNELLSGYSRGRADGLIEQTTVILGYFRPGTDDTVQDWERLKRYRGIAISKIAQNSGILEDDKIELGIDDLQRVMQVAPEDTESLIELMNLRYAKVNLSTSQDAMGPRREALRENLALTNEYLSEYPKSAFMRIQKLKLEADLARSSIDPSLENSERIEILTQRFAGFAEELDSIADDLTGAQSDQLDLQTVLQFGGVESRVDGASRFSRARRLLDQLLEEDRQNAEVLFYAGNLAKRAGDNEEADAWFKQITELETKPLSYAGFRQFNFQRLALFHRSEIKIEEAQASLTDDGREDLLTQAKLMRDQLSEKVGDDNQLLLMLNGRLAEAEDRLDEALRIFKRYNELTQQSNTDGLWYEGAVAAQLGQYGVAREALLPLVDENFSPRQIQALMTLGQIHEDLQEYELAAEYFEQVTDLRPEYQVAIDALADVNRRLNPELYDDPALAAIFTARQIRFGDEDTPGDYAGSIEYLREKVVELDYESQVSRELASLLLDRNDVEGAKMLIGNAAAKNPDDEGLQRMLSAMNAGDTTQILVQMIREAPGPLLDRLVTIASIASSRNEPELLAETVAELNELAPNDKRVIDLTFFDSLARGDIARAEQISKNPSNTQLQSMMYQARIAMAQQQPDRAIELLNQAAATGTADPSVFQLLAVLQRDTGRMNEALASFEQALSIRQDNPDSIREYVITLTRAGQYENALEAARRYQRYATGDAVFMNLWLTLEAQFGAQQGRDFATRQRERMLELNPNDTDNAFQLARLYILDRDWDSARALIDTLRSGEDRIEFVELEATWYADQGVVNGRDGLTLANEVYSNYIASLPEPVGPEPFIASSQFMLSRGRPDLALAAANKAVERQSSDTMIGSILLGDLYMRINNLPEAIKAFRDVLDAGADNENATVRARLIDALVRLGRFDEAQEAYDGFPDSKSSDMLTMIQGADIAAGRGDDARARQILDNAVSAFPNNPLVYIKRAQMMVGDPTLRDDMLSDLNRALQLNPQSWRAYLIRASGYFALNQRDEALSDLKATIRLNPNQDSQVNSVLNEVLSRPGRAGEAADIAREVLSQRSNDANLMSRIGGLFASRQHWDYAAEFYEMAWNKRRSPSDGATFIDALVRLTPPNAEKANAVINELAALVGNINENSGLLAAQALVLQARGREDFAQQQITKAFDLSTDEDSKLLNWANNLSRYFEGRDTREQVAYLEALKRRNTDARVAQWLEYFIAHRLMQESGERDRAYAMIASLESESIPDPIAIRAYRLHATTLYADNDYEEAARVWTEGLGRFPDDWEMNNNLAYTLSSDLGRPDEALAYAEKAVSQNTGYSEPYETIASIYIALGKYDEAEQMIDTGSSFINSIPARITMTLTSARLAMKRGDMEEARSRLTNAKAVLRSAPKSYPSLDEDIEEFEQELDTAEN